MRVLTSQGWGPLWEAVQTLLREGSDGQVLAIASHLSDMRCRNGRVTEWSVVLSGLTGSNATPLPLAVGAGAKLALHGWRPRPS